jgi:hypothetical protein
MVFLVVRKGAAVASNATARVAGETRHPARSGLSNLDEKSELETVEQKRLS